MNDITKLEQDALFPLDCSVDTIAELLNKFAVMKQKIKEAEALFKARMLERIEQSGPVTVGSIRFYAGNKKEVESRDDLKTAEACLALAGGDIAAMFRDFICAGPFKQGNIRKHLNDDTKFDELFLTTTKAVLAEGKPVKQLMSADERFVGTGSKAAIAAGA